MTPLPWCPKFVVGTTEYLFTYPVTRWIPGRRITGTTARDATGGPGYDTRLRRSTLGMTVRFLDSQWPMFREFFTSVRNGRTFDWFPRALMIVPDMPESFSVTLDSPRLADGLRPTRDTQYIRLLTIPIVLASPEVMHAYYFPVT